MSNQHNHTKDKTTSKSPELKRTIVTRYSRPIDFVAESSTIPTNDTKRSKLESNGDEVASFYRNIVASPSETLNDKKKTSTTKADVRKSETNLLRSSWWCEYCTQSVPLSDYKRHIQGTAHMVSKNISSKSALEILALNGKNIGFKMMKSQGWKYEEGLGSEGQGRRIPIATVLKQDRLGVGHKETGRKVITHKYKDIEKRALKKQRMEVESKRDPGKEIARKAKAETEKRNAILRYLKN